MAYIKRDIEDKIISLSKEYSCILITGPRQVGKTTVLRQLMDDNRIRGRDAVISGNPGDNAAEVIIRLHVGFHIGVGTDLAQFPASAAFERMIAVGIQRIGKSSRPEDFP